MSDHLDRRSLGRFALRRKAEGVWPASEPGWIPGIDLPTTWAEADATRCQLREADKFEVVDRWELRDRE